ncbi:N-alpha-acetyltransferase 80 [Diorhabda sublineata]|uniref:N-alpha-acetyltransferase 80 n=1 Tax=Diorhabda sublineata TaxID=1163346 RepID=UPI0024E051AA|nr:N-alpha-acetyltransferase 80 [Diorhabda sublineata]
MTLEVVPIHKHPEYLLDCCNIINQEWKRSKTARLHSLEQSCDHLPTSLILLKDKTVIGHLKLSVIPNIKTACFVESVVVEMNHRNKGYGSMLMREAENFCRGLGLNAVYLSTKGKEEFYVKLGYKICAPVSIYGNFVPKNMDTVNIVLKPFKLSDEANENTTKGVYPPTPPPPPSLVKIVSSKKIFMKKIL